MTHTHDDGETKVNVIHQGYLYDQYQIFLDGNLTKDLVIAAGAGTAIIGGPLAGTAAAATGPLGGIAVTALAAIITAEAAWLGASNDGHGVVIDMVILNDYVNPGPDNLPYHYIQGQEHL